MGWSEPPLGVCFRFWQDGSCRNAGECPFSHVKPVAPAMAMQCGPPDPHDTETAKQDQKGTFEGSVGACTAALVSAGPPSLIEPGRVGTAGTALQPSASASRPNQLGVCWMFARGACRAGSTCKFLHRQATANSDAVQSSMASCRDATAPPLQPPQSSMHATSGQRLGVCWMFARGACRAGTKCKFLHRPPTADADAEQRSVTSCRDATAPPLQPPQSSMHANSGQRPSKRHKTDSLSLGPCAVITAETTQEFELAINRLKQVTEYCTKARESVPDGHEDWLRELLQDVALVTGYGPAQVLSTTRNLLRDMIQAVHAHQVAGTAVEEGGTAAEMCGPHEGGGAVFRYDLLHRIKLTSLAALKQRSSSTRTDLQQMLTADCDTCGGPGGSAARRAVWHKAAHEPRPSRIPSRSAAPEQEDDVARLQNVRTEIILCELCSEASILAMPVENFSAANSAEGKGGFGPQQAEVGMMYVRDATGCVVVEMAQALPPCKLLDALLICDGFTLVCQPSDQRARRVPVAGGTAMADSAMDGAGDDLESGCQHALMAESQSDHQMCHLELWSARGIAVSRCPYYNIHDVGVEGKQDLEGELPDGLGGESATVDVADPVEWTRARQGKVLHQINVEGRVLSISPILDHARREGPPTRYFLLELGSPCLPSRPVLRPHTASAPESGIGGAQRSGSTSTLQCSKLLFFQGPELLKWYPLLRVDACIVVTSVSRAKFGGKQGIPCWKAGEGARVFERRLKASQTALFASPSDTVCDMLDVDLSTAQKASGARTEHGDVGKHLLKNKYEAMGCRTFEEPERNPFLQLTTSAGEVEVSEEGSDDGGSGGDSDPTAAVWHYHDALAEMHAKSQNGTDALVLGELADKCCRQGKFEGAMRCFAHMCTGNLVDRATHFGRGLLLRDCRQGRSEKEAHMEKAVMSARGKGDEGKKKSNNNNVLPHGNFSDISVVDTAFFDFGKAVDYEGKITYVCDAQGTYELDGATILLACHMPRHMRRRAFRVGAQVAIFNVIPLIVSSKLVGFCCGPFTQMHVVSFSPDDTAPGRMKTQCGHQQKSAGRDAVEDTWNWVSQNASFHDCWRVLEIYRQLEEKFSSWCKPRTLLKNWSRFADKNGAQGQRVSGGGMNSAQSPDVELGIIGQVFSALFAGATIWQGLASSRTSSQCSTERRITMYSASHNTSHATERELMDASFSTKSDLWTDCGCCNAGLLVTGPCHEQPRSVKQEYLAFAQCRETMSHPNILPCVALVIPSLRQLHDAIVLFCRDRERQNASVARVGGQLGRESGPGIRVEEQTVTVSGSDLVPFILACQRRHVLEKREHDDQPVEQHRVQKGHERTRVLLIGELRLEMGRDTEGGKIDEKCLVLCDDTGSIPLVIPHGYLLANGGLRISDLLLLSNWSFVVPGTTSDPAHPGEPFLQVNSEDGDAGIAGTASEAVACMQSLRCLLRRVKSNETEKAIERDNHEDLAVQAVGNEGKKEDMEEVTSVMGLVDMVMDVERRQEAQPQRLYTIQGVVSSIRSCYSDDENWKQGYPHDIARDVTQKTILEVILSEPLKAQTRVEGKSPRLRPSVGVYIDAGLQGVPKGILPGALVLCRGLRVHRGFGDGSSAGTHADGGGGQGNLRGRVWTTPAMAKTSITILRTAPPTRSLVCGVRGGATVEAEAHGQVIHLCDLLPSDDRSGLVTVVGAFTILWQVTIEMVCKHCHAVAVAKWARKEGGRCGKSELLLAGAKGGGGTSEAGSACDFCYVVKAAGQFEDGSGVCRVEMEGEDLVLRHLLGIAPHDREQVLQTAERIGKISWRKEAHYEAGLKEAQARAAVMNTRPLDATTTESVSRALLVLSAAVQKAVAMGGLTKVRLLCQRMPGGELPRKTPTKDLRIEAVNLGPTVVRPAINMAVRRIERLDATMLAYQLLDQCTKKHD